MTMLFGTAPVDGMAWVWALMVGLLVFGAVESEKAWRRRGEPASKRIAATPVNSRQ
jgi:hypothetical protein